MKLLYEDDLVEGVAQVCAAGQRVGIPLLQIRRYQAERDRCYRMLDPDERAAAFARVHSRWFVEWGFDDWLASVAARFPVLEPSLAALAFRRARARGDEGAELYRDPEGERRGMMAVRPERFADEAGLLRLLHHELAHVADMVDPSFGYAPDWGGASLTPSQQRLARERYRLLWAVSIDGRLTGRGLVTVADEGRRRQEFERGFAFLAEERRADVFAALWSGRLAEHAALLALATDPRGRHNGHAPAPGAPCSLCGFATFAWGDVERLGRPAVERIRAEFPGWEEGQPVCARCAEMYEAITGMAYPATVCL